MNKKPKLQIHKPKPKTTIQKPPSNIVEFSLFKLETIGNIRTSTLRELNDLELISLNLEVSKIQIERLMTKRAG